MTILQCRRQKYSFNLQFSELYRCPARSVAHNNGWRESAVSEIAQAGDAEDGESGGQDRLRERCRLERQEAGVHQVIAAGAVPDEGVIPLRECLIDLEVELVAIMLRTGLKRKLFATPQSRFGSGNKFSRLRPTGLIRFAGTRLSGKASLVN